ncbi:MAG: hypothetical protein QG633_342 [Patescibacteria group bacterium]|jgi:hypothetical protein|nr:hypothetical protein [Patescibacteria group bacterium]
MKKSRKLNIIATVVLLLPVFLVLYVRLADMGIGGFAFVPIIIVLLPVSFLLAFVFYFLAARAHHKEMISQPAVTATGLRQHINPMLAVGIIFVVACALCGYFIFSPLMFLFSNIF